MKMIIRLRPGVMERAMERTGMSIQELSRVTKLSRPTIYGILEGRYESLQMGTVKKIMRAFEGERLKLREVIEVSVKQQ